MSLNPVHIIRKKRDGEPLTPEETEAFIKAAAEGAIPDYQVAAFLMAVYFRGMAGAETVELTRQMLLSGTTLQWAAEGGPYVDKHSTGGIGDKVSLVLAPLLACCGVRVPMISGRGLGATGGTLDKLEAIPGYRTNLSIAELQAVCTRVGCVITGATADLAPADKRLYALRDVTATVESIPLITASILSKKLAAGLQALVLDIKWGSGAFMKALADAERLAESLVAVGSRLGMRTSALITDMNQPLGRMIGNAVEVQESIDALEERGPADLMDVTLALGAELLVLCAIADNDEAAMNLLTAALRSGRGREKFFEMVSAQGGDLSVPLCVAPASDILASHSGYVTAVHAELLGRAIISLGGGRTQVGDQVDPSVGLEMLVRIGDPIRSGQPLLKIFAQQRGAEEARRLALSAVIIGDQPAEPPRLIVGKRSVGDGENL